jgi:hypothetical protein
MRRSTTSTFRDTAPSLGLPLLEAECYSNQALSAIGTSPDSIQAMKTLANDPFFAGAR